MLNELYCEQLDVLYERRAAAAAQDERVAAESSDPVEAIKYKGELGVCYNLKFGGERLPGRTSPNDS